MDRTKVFTIGHSNRTIEDFINILKKYDIKNLIDVRSIPKSRYNPQFNKENLKECLIQNNIKYTYMEGLGGFRPINKDNVNSGWENKSFKGYADYMQTEPFNKNLKDLMKMLNNETSVIMCAEVLPWRCHRFLIADILTVNGYEVSNIINEKSVSVHKVTPFAKVKGDRITYPKPS